MEGKPLVSFVVVAYKQEHFIREAVRSALSQEYQPLEIIISDDCSPDLTFHIMKEEVAAYHGNHTVRLIRNDENIGLVRHLELVAQSAKGEFIVIQAGDDISLPNRTDLLVDSWLRPTPVDLVCSDVFVIDENGKTIREKWNRPYATPLTLDQSILAGGCVAIGCSCGYSRRLFTKFSPMSDIVFQEDNVMPFRAMLLNGVRVVPDSLVGYRQHSNNIYFGKGRSNESLERKVFVAKGRWGIACDVIKAWDECSMPHDVRYERLKKIERYWWYYAACAGSNFSGVVCLAIKGLFDGLTIRNAVGLVWKKIRV
jgi:glycosyltransferase involved in cell wall biosynthesis